MARYIDIEAVGIGKAKREQFLVPEYADGWNNAIAILENEPTADVEEVRHSRWENISGFDVCNICGTSPAYCEPKPNNPKGYPPYCHNCGAKMDGTPKERGGEK